MDMVNDERVIIHRKSLFAGFVRSDGHIGVVRHDFATGQSHAMTLSCNRSREKDDHNNPSLTVLPDGRILASYSRHGTASEAYQRVSKVVLPSHDEDWEDELLLPLPARNTYSNTYLLRHEGDVLFRFHRCINFNPTLSVSHDLGITWDAPLHFIQTGQGGVRPYPRYVSNGQDRIDLILTDGHPHDVDNSVYHIFYQGGAFRMSNGSKLGGLDALPLDHDNGRRGSEVYRFRSDPWSEGEHGADDWIPNGRAWTWDIHYDKGGFPVCVFQVQLDNRSGESWKHSRIYYYYARWTGTEWQRRFVSHGGRGLYEREVDYGGGMSIDPEDPRVVYISSNAANPFNLENHDDVPLRQDERYEIWRGITEDDGLTFRWDAVTKDSKADNLRPVVPEGFGKSGCLVWLRGSYRSYKDYQMELTLRIL